MKVGIAFDLAPASGPPSDGPDDRFEEFDKPETVHAIADVIRGEGHEVVLLGDGRPFLEKVLADPPDFVWNIAEGEGVGRCREARVPAALEMLGIPYSGSDPFTLAACLDKGTTRQLLGDQVVMPRGLSLPPVEWTPENRERIIGKIVEVFELRVPASRMDFPFTPVILKPAFEGSSKGIRDNVIARSEQEFAGIWSRLVRNYHQPIVVEEFIIGEEVTVGICGNPDPAGGEQAEILGIMQISPNQPDPAFVYSLEVKRDWRNRVHYTTPARLNPAAVAALEVSARNAYDLLGCRDFARIDFRLNPEDTPYFIEANPLPGLAPVTSDLVILAEGYGLSHADLIRKLFQIALKRVGLS